MGKSMRIAPCALTTILLLLASPANADDWPRFRGPNGSGISNATTVPVRWTEQDVNWKVKLPGVGHSSPVVWGDRIFLTSADEATGQRYVTCLRADDGRQLWQNALPGARHGKH